MAHQPLFIPILSKQELKEKLAYLLFSRSRALNTNIGVSIRTDGALCSSTVKTFMKPEQQQAWANMLKSAESPTLEMLLLAEFTLVRYFAIYSNRYWPYLFYWVFLAA